MAASQLLPYTGVFTRYDSTITIYRSKGSANENYVKLNLRKKTYTRGKKVLKGAAYKRQQWRNKMSAKSKSSGCFKCGEEGHWAKNCTSSSKGSRKDVEPGEAKSHDPIVAAPPAATAGGIWER